jgi:hypothetical protein
MQALQHAQACGLPLGRPDRGLCVGASPAAQFVYDVLRAEGVVSALALDARKRGKDFSSRDHGR